MSRSAGTCPHCGKPRVTPQREWQLVAQAAGRCLRCNHPKSDVDMPFRNCHACRVVIAANARRRYAPKRKSDRGMAA